MNYKKIFIFLKKLTYKLDKFYEEKNSTNLSISNKSKNKNNFDPVTNFDRAFEKYIRKIIQKSFPRDSIIGEEFKDKKTTNDFMWSIDPIDGTRAFVIGAPTWSNLVSLSYKKRINKTGR